MMFGRVLAVAFVLAASTLFPGAARAEFRRIEMKIVGMD
jgi:hypothetical protein